MSKTPEEHLNTIETHEKNREDLEITKEKLKKELSSIMDLIGLDAADNNSIDPSDNQPNAVISRRDFINLIEMNKKLQSDVEILKNSITNLQYEINSVRENLRIIKGEKPNITLIEEQIADLREKIKDFEIGTPPLRESITEVALEETHAHDENISIESEVQDKNEIRVEVAEVEVEKISETTHRRRCPTCSNGNQRYIRELPDKDNIISYSPRIYGKKYKCGICTTEWK